MQSRKTRQLAPFIANLKNWGGNIFTILPGIAKDAAFSATNTRRARAVVEYLLENKLLEVDEAKYVGPEYDPTYNGAEIVDLNF